MAHGYQNRPRGTVRVVLTRSLWLKEARRLTARLFDCRTRGSDLLLEYLDRLRDLATRHVLDESKNDDFLLLGGEVLHGATQSVDRFAVDRAFVCRRSVFGDAVCVVEVDHRPFTTATIGDRVARDGVEPREERFSLPAVAMDVRERSGEDFAREVFGIRRLAHAVQKIAVDRIDVAVVELGERPAISRLRAGEHIRNRSGDLNLKRGDLGDA